MKKFYLMMAVALTAFMTSCGSKAESQANEEAQEATPEVQVNYEDEDFNFETTADDVDLEDYFNDAYEQAEDMYESAQESANDMYKSAQKQADDMYNDAMKQAEDMMNAYGY